MSGTYIERLLSSIEKCEDADEQLNVEYWASRVVSEWPHEAADQIMSAGADMATLVKTAQRIAPQTMLLVTAGALTADECVAHAATWLQSLLDCIYLESGGT